MLRGVSQPKAQFCYVLIGRAPHPLTLNLIST
jgi:hypothetical protein